MTHILLSFQGECLTFENNTYRYVTGSEPVYSNTFLTYFLYLWTLYQITLNRKHGYCLSRNKECNVDNIPFKLHIKCKVEKFNDVELSNNTENHWTISRVTWGFIEKWKNDTIYIFLNVKNRDSLEDRKQQWWLKEKRDYHCFGKENRDLNQSICRT